MKVLERVRPARLFLFLMALLLLTASGGNPFAPIETPVRAGDEHMSQGEFTLALQPYREALNSFPRRATILLRLGRATEALHRWSEARDTYAAARRYPWTKARATAGLARIASAEGDTWRASPLWEEAARLGGNDADVLLGYVRFLWHRGAFVPARRWVERVLRLEPSNAEARYCAGILSLLEGNLPAAEEHLALAAQGSGADLQSRAAMLLSAAQAGKGMDSPDHLMRVGVALLRAGEQTSACTLFRQARALASASPVAGAYWGYCLALAGNEAGARGVLHDVSRQFPEYPLVWYFLGEVARMTGHPAEARTHYLKLLDLDAGNSAACVALAETYVEENAFPEAEGWLLKAVELSPEDGQFWLTLAQFYVNRLVSVADKGVAAAERAVELLPDDPAARDALGWAYFLSNDSGRAKRELERALRLDDRSAAIQYHAGSLYYALGDREKALYHLTRAVDIEPEGRYAALAEDLLRRLGE